MTEEQTEAERVIFKTLLNLPWIDRAEVFSAVRFNAVFCCSCGYGSIANPNLNCQCGNDE